MAKRPILGLFTDPNQAADAGDGLRSSGVEDTDFDFLTDAPYPEGAFGEREEKHRLYLFPFIGALLGLTSGILLTSMTQVAYPLATGGKPILALPPHGGGQLRGHHAGGHPVHGAGGSSSSPACPSSRWACTIPASPTATSGSWSRPRRPSTTGWPRS